MSDRDSNSFLWFLAGLGVGALVGVLYAPRAGMRSTPQRVCVRIAAPTRTAARSRSTRRPSCRKSFSRDECRQPRECCSTPGNGREW